MDRDRLRELSRKKIKKESSKMMRKLTVISTVISLVVGLCLMGVTPVLAQKSYSTLTEYEKATGEKITRFNEAPMLKALVDAGELPPVEQRLPEEPLVLEPKDEIGQYGGTLNTGSEYVNWDSLAIRTRTQNLFRLSPVSLTLVPNIAKGWDISKDYKTLTVYLRKGMKWSDGAPFTADDILFWYNDALLNDELTPVKPKNLSPGGKLVKVKKLNDYAVRFQFAVPHPPILTYFVNMPSEGGIQLFYPKHYLKKWHIKYNPKADEIAKEEGFDHWYECFGSHVPQLLYTDVNLPTLDSFTLEKVDSSGNRYLKRNPYYFKIDTAGNQLPYIDKGFSTHVASIEVLELKTIAGDFSYIGRTTSLENYPLYQKNAEKGGYRVMLGRNPRTELAFSFNITSKDPVKREIFSDIRFRQAMSLALDRQEMSDILYYGKATPVQCAPPPTTSFYEDWMGKYYVEHDPTKANRLLDEMGLNWDKNHKYRLRPDGKTLAITLEFAPAEPVVTKLWELIRDYWEKVGVKADLKQIQETLYFTHWMANELDVGSWGWELIERGLGLQHAAWKFLPSALGACLPWDEWYISDGKMGEEPPEKVKELFKLTEEFAQTLIGTEEYEKIGKELVTKNLENLYMIGTVSNSPRVVLFDANLRNVPEEEGTIFNFIYGSWGFYEPDQWFFKK